MAGKAWGLDPLFLTGVWSHTMQVQGSKLTAFTVDIKSFLDLLIENEESDKTTEDKPASFKTMRESLYDLALDQFSEVKALGIAKENFKKY